AAGRRARDAGRAAGDHSDAGRRDRRRRAGPRPGCRPGGAAVGVAATTRHRGMDRQLHRAAGAGRPGRVPTHRPRGAPGRRRPGPAGRSPRARRVRGPSLGALALVRPPETVEVRVNHTIMSTPVGPLTIVVTDTGEVRAAGFTADPRELPVPPGELAGSVARADLGEVGKAVTAYLDGDLTAIDPVPVVPFGGGGFVTAAWRALRATPPGQPVSYAGLAALAGRPAAVRAAASACARNPGALFVPCHRVRRSDGGLGGYRWGLPVKRWLLAHEAAHG